MSTTRLEALRTKAKLLQKAKAKAGKPIQLKQAFTLIAQAAGFSSWQDLKATVDANAVLCPTGHSALWKVWYASYPKALAHLEANGGFLMPYQKDFFICDETYIQFLGISPQDADLQKVGPNWVEPQDPQALRRLLTKLQKKT